MASAHSNLDRRVKRGRFGNKTWKRDSGNDKPKSKGELHAYIQSMVNNAVKQSEKKRKADDPPADVDLDEFNYDITWTRNLPTSKKSSNCRTTMNEDVSRKLRVKTKILILKLIAMFLMSI